jgi:hypothetical protein
VKTGKSSLSAGAGFLDGIALVDDCIAAVEPVDQVFSAIERAAQEAAIGQETLPTPHPQHQSE